MGQITQHKPVALIIAVTSGYPEALQWSADQTAAQWGPIAHHSPMFDFTETNYYIESMGHDLKKQFFVFENLINPGAIAKTKLVSNQLEQDYRQQTSVEQSRPVNIDPGYISEAKLVLVTTKDRDHRIYLSDGIFAEVTLHFRSGGWRDSRWTYPDYQRDDFQKFFTDCRQWLRGRLKNQVT